MNRRTDKRTPTLTVRRNGFTLIEVALAMAVVVIGVLALFSLISAGLDASNRAIADTHSATFANDVFGGLRSISLEMAESGVTGRWENFWIKFQDGDTNLVVAAPDAWYSMVAYVGSGRKRRKINLPLSVFGDGEIHTNIFKDIPFHDSKLTNVVNIALRYKCDVNFLYPSTVLWSNRAEVTLTVWDGEFGSKNLKDAMIYYSEFDNPGDL